MENRERRPETYQVHSINMASKFLIARGRAGDKSPLAKPLVYCELLSLKMLKGTVGKHLSKISTEKYM